MKGEARFRTGGSRWEGKNESSFHPRVLMRVFDLLILLVEFCRHWCRNPTITKSDLKHVLKFAVWIIQDHERTNDEPECI